MLWRAKTLVAIVVCGALLGCDDPAKPRVATSVAVTPDEALLCASETRQLEVTVLDANQEEIPDAEVTWSSGDPDVATVSGSGVVTAVAGGSAVIRAAQGTVFGEATIGVRAPEVRISISEPWVFVGDTVRFSAQVVDLNDIVPPEAPTDWSSGTASIATVTSSGLITGVQAGVATVSAQGPCDVADSVDVSVLDEPDGPELVYIRSVVREDEPSMWQVKIVSIDGSGARAITPSTEYVQEFAWSADGNRVVLTYASINGVTRGGSVVVDANGRNEVPLGQTLLSPQWSPDGSRIAFRDHISSGESDVYTIRPDGSDLQRLSDQPGDELSPMWSLDGQEILYVHNTTGSEPELWIVAADGLNRRQITLPTGVANPRWSPDGEEIAFDNGSGIWIVGADGENPRPFTPNCSDTGMCSGPDRYLYPAWSPDGQRLAYAREREGTMWSLVIASADGAGTPIADVSATILCCEPLVPHWSPDGSHVAFDSRLPDGQPWPTIAVVDANGNGLRFVTGEENAFPRGWRPGIRP